MELEIKTLMGLDMPTVIAQLDAQLEPAAYSAVPGAVDLTDIKPAWLVETLNRLFGIAGYGWWFSYSPADLTVTEGADSKGRAVYKAALNQLALYYRLVVNGQIEVAGPIFANGYSDNYDYGYAVRGALTNAQGAAASKLGWQLSVYQDKRSHRDFFSPAETVIPFGKHKGQKMSEAPVDYVRWLVDNTKSQTLKAAAEAYLESLDGGAPASAATAPAESAAPAAQAPAAPADPEITFGKHKGRRLSEVFAEDQSYVAWLAENTKQAHIQAAAAAVVAAQGAAKSAPADAPAPAAAATSSSDPEITFGKYKGRRLSAVCAEDQSYVAWLAENAKQADIKTAAATLIAGLPQATPAAAPAAASGNGNGNDGPMALEAALKVTLPFGTRANPGLKDQPLAVAEKTEPAFVDFLASPKGAKYPELHAAAQIVVAQRVTAQAA